MATKKTNAAKRAAKGGAQPKRSAAAASTTSARATSGGPARKDTQRALVRATPFLRRQVGGRVRLKTVPTLEFFYDESIERQDRIEKIMLDIQAERAANPHLNDLAAGDDEPDDDKR